MNKRKLKLKRVLTIILSITLIVGMITACAFIFKPKQSKKVYPVYHVGSINSNGAYVESDDAIYSDLFECQGLVVKPKFTSNVTYSVFFYDFSEKFIDSSTNLSANFEISNDERIKYARILINPDLNGQSVEDHKIWVWQVPSISNNLVVTVNNNQSKMSNLYEVVGEGSYNSSENTNYVKLAPIDVSNIKNLVFVFDGNIDAVNDIVCYQFSTSESAVGLNIPNDSKIVTLDVSAKTGNIYISVKPEYKISIYKYN